MPRIPNAEHEHRPWRIHTIAADFEVEDVWALPVTGGAGDFHAFVDMVTDGEPELGRGPARALWVVRDRLGEWLRLGRTTAPATDTTSWRPIPGTTETSLRTRLPADLEGSADGIRFTRLAFEPVYLTPTEFVAEMSNATVHALMHLAWVHDHDDRWRAEMAVYVKPRGRFGRAYMGFIKPFRYAIVYPVLMRAIGLQWERHRAARRAQAASLAQSLIGLAGSARAAESAPGAIRLARPSAGAGR